MRQRSREQVIGAALACWSTSIIVIEFLVDSKINTAPPPRIVYVDSWTANRTDAEIIADRRSTRRSAKRRRNGSANSRTREAAWNGLTTSAGWARRSASDLPSAAAPLPTPTSAA
jgi:hypothetical protein